MENITIGELATICGVILALYTFYKTLKKDFNSMLDDKLDPLEKKINTSLNAQFQIMNHMIDGNHIDKLKSLRDKMQSELIDGKD